MHALSHALYLNQDKWACIGLHTHGVTHGLMKEPVLICGVNDMQISSLPHILQDVSSFDALYLRLENLLFVAEINNTHC